MCDCENGKWDGYRAYIRIEKPEGEYLLEVRYYEGSAPTWEDPGEPEMVEVELALRATGDDPRELTVTETNAFEQANDHLIRKATAEALRPMFDFMAAGEHLAMLSADEAMEKIEREEG